MASQRTENWQGMNWIRQEKRLAIYIRDNFICQHCQQDLRKIVGKDGIRIELDHVVPVSKGGSNAASNLLTSCSNCNTRRGDKDIEETHPMHSDQARIARQLAQPLNMALAKQVLAERKSNKEV